MNVQNLRAQRVKLLHMLARHDHQIPIDSPYLVHTILELPVALLQHVVEAVHVPLGCCREVPVRPEVQHGDVDFGLFGTTELQVIRYEKRDEEHGEYDGGKDKKAEQWPGGSAGEESSGGALPKNAGKDGVRIDGHLHERRRVWRCLGALC